MSSEGLKSILLDRLRADFLLKRLLLLAPTLLGILMLVFLLTRVIGNPVSMALGDRLSEAELAQRLETLGYNRPYVIQFWEYLSRLSIGDFGVSVRTGESVSEIVLRFLPGTIELGILTLAFAFPASIALGKYAQKNEGSRTDTFLRLMALASYGVPVFLAATLLRLVFSDLIPILPSNGRASLETEIYFETAGSSGFYFLESLIRGRFDLTFDLAVHSVLPMLTLGVYLISALFRVTRAAYIVSANSEQVAYARVMGLPDKVVYRKFISRNALGEIISMFGMTFAIVLTGVVLTETAFEWRGLGYAVNHYISAREFDVVQGLCLLLTFIVVVAHSITDWLAKIAIPKTRLKK